MNMKIDDGCIIKQLIAALQLAKDMIIANGLDLPNTMGVIDAALDKARNYND